MKYYLTLENFPIQSNSPQKDWTEITEKQFKNRCNEINAQIEADQKQREEDTKPIRERNKLIQQRMREIAEQQLIDEGVIDNLQEAKKK